MCARARVCVCVCVSGKGYGGGGPRRGLRWRCGPDLCACMWRRGHRVPPCEEARVGVAERPFPLQRILYTVSRCAAGAHRACARGIMPRAEAHRSDAHRPQWKLGLDCTQGPMRCIQGYTTNRGDLLTLGGQVTRRIGWTYRPLGSTPCIHLGPLAYRGAGQEVDRNDENEFPMVFENEVRSPHSLLMSNPD